MSSLLMSSLLSVSALASSLRPWDVMTPGLQTAFQAADKASDLSFFLIIKGTQPADLDEQIKMLEASGCEVNKSQTKILSDGVSSFRLVGTPRQIVAVIKKFNLAGKVILAGLGNPQIANTRTSKQNCDDLLGHK